MDPLLSTVCTEFKLAHERNMSLSDVGFLAVLLVQGSKHPHGPVTGYLVASATPDDLVRLGPGPESLVVRMTAGNGCM